MTDPEDADYVCTLTECSLQKAIEEQHEDPKQRLGAVQALRKWIREQPHYTCRTDTKFLLEYLRRAKFSQLIARELIDNFMNVRTHFPQLVANLDVQDPILFPFLDRGAILHLPKEGRLIVLFRPGMWDLKDPRFSPVNQVRYSLTVAGMHQDADENISVNGLAAVFDCSGTQLKHFTQYTTQDSKIITKAMEDAFPFRIKAYHIYNPGSFVEVFMGIVKALLKKKMQERVYVHSTMESLYKVIPMELWPEEYLPDDYIGPSAGSIDDIIAGLKKRLTNPERRARFLELTSDKYKIDESKRPRDNIPRESFRKLNID